MFSILPANESHLTAMLEVERASHQAPWSEGQLLGSLLGDHLCWVLVEKGEVIGQLILLPVLDQLELLNIAVNPSRQGQGWGRQLMQFLLEYAKNQSYHQIFLEVRESNQPAIALYRSCGFEIVGLRKNYYPSPDGRENALLMARC